MITNGVTILEKEFMESQIRKNHAEKDFLDKIIKIEEERLSTEQQILDCLVRISGLP